MAAADCCVYANELIYGVHRPDLIILDVQQPRMRGDKKARILKSREKSRGIPVLLTAAQGEEELRRMAASTGVEGYLRKPFVAVDLLSAVARHLVA